MTPEEPRKNIDERLAELNRKLKEQAERMRRNDTEAVYLFLEQIILPELRTISARLERLEAAIEEGFRNEDDEEGK